MENLTCLYYTANKENEDFEKKVQKNLLKYCGDIPIVSVSQKPINLGYNICVGEHGNSYINEYRQILTGLKEIKTEYFISCEADFLYPPDYFTFKPNGADIYRSDNVWIVKKYYNKKAYSEGAQIAKTKYMIDFIEGYLEGLPLWFDGRPDETMPFYDTYIKHQKELWRLPFTFFGCLPCLSFKTGNGVRKATEVEQHRVRELPYWGEIISLKEKYL